MITYPIIYPYSITIIIQAFFLISNDGTNYVDRSTPITTGNTTTNIPLEWGYAGFLYIDNWVHEPKDINATHFAIYAVPLNMSITTISKTIPRPIPANIQQAAIAYSIMVRTVDLPQCAKDLLENDLPQCTECTMDETDTTNSYNNEVIRAKSGAVRNHIISRSIGVFIAGIFGCLSTLKR